MDKLYKYSKTVRHPMYYIHVVFRKLLLYDFDVQCSVTDVDLLLPERIV